jgi:hypothetical protein
VTPLPGEEILRPCEYRVVLPESTGPVRAFSGEHRLALVLVIQCRSKEREGMIVEPSKGVGRALFTAPDQFADSEHLRVLREAGFVESTVDAQRRLYRLKPEPLQEIDAWLLLTCQSVRFY